MYTCKILIGIVVYLEISSSVYSDTNENVTATTVTIAPTTTAIATSATTSLAASATTSLAASATPTIAASATATITISAGPSTMGTGPQSSPDLSQKNRAQSYSGNGKLALILGISSISWLMSVFCV